MTTNDYNKVEEDFFMDYDDAFGKMDAEEFGDFDKVDMDDVNPKRAKYCNTCGFCFVAATDNYCPACGSKRLNIQNKPL